MNYKRVSGIILGILIWSMCAVSWWRNGFTSLTLEIFAGSLLYLFVILDLFRWYERVFDLRLNRVQELTYIVVILVLIEIAVQMPYKPLVQAIIMSVFLLSFICLYLSIMGRQNQRNYRLWKAFDLKRDKPNHYIS